MRVCILGSSHLAALKRAWDVGDASNFEVIQPTFLGSHTDSLKKVHCVAGRFHTDDPQVRRSLAMTSGLPDPELSIGDFDAFFVHALFNPNWITPYTLRAIRHAKSHGMLSSGLVRAVSQEILSRSGMIHMVRVIRTASDVPIVVSPQPYLSQAVLTSPDKGPAYASLEQLEDYTGPNFTDAFGDVLRAQGLKSGFSVLPQPLETIVMPCFSAHEFCVGSVRLTSNLDIEHPDDDFSHMNSAYGALVLRQLAAHFADAVTAA